MKSSLLGLAFVVAIGTQAAAQASVVMIVSKYSVPETADRLEAAVKAENFVVFSRIDYRALAASQGGKIPPSQLVIFARGGALQEL
jgi:uncharacterized protein (DUF302 family)